MQACVASLHSFSGQNGTNLVNVRTLSTTQIFLPLQSRKDTRLHIKFKVFASLPKNAMRQASAQDCAREHAKRSELTCAGAYALSNVFNASRTRAMRIKQAT